MKVHFVDNIVSVFFHILSTRSEWLNSVVNTSEHEFQFLTFGMYFKCRAS